MTDLSKNASTKTMQTSAESPIIVNVARLSFIWAEVLPDFLAKDASITGPFSKLTRSCNYSPLFNEALTRGGSTIFSVPWEKGKKQKFWMGYLTQGKLDDVRGANAWDNLVPLLIINPGFEINEDWFRGSCFIHAFYYPFGIAVTINFRWKPKCSLEALTREASEFKRHKYSVFDDNSPPLSLYEVADKFLVTLRQNALGANAAPGIRTTDLFLNEPFSLLTILDAEGVNPKEDICSNSNIMKALELLTTCSLPFDDLTLPKPEDVCLSIKRDTSKGGALYANHRGRVVWLPVLFLAGKKTILEEPEEQSQGYKQLNCYHKNLVFASLQTESLGILISEAAKIFRGGKDKNYLTFQHRKMVENAAKCLRKLYLGDKKAKDTWRSASIRKQIDDCWLSELQTVLVEFGIDPL